MELTRDNYYDIEPKILKDIEECDFISFDLEFSGLIQNKFKIYDSPEEYFEKLKYNAENFRIIQLGITIFKKNLENPKEYTAKPYCIYVFPSEKQNNNKFNFLLGAIIFNREHGCDFNKWISKGVPYLNEENLNKLIERTTHEDINKYNLNISSMFKKINLYKQKDKNIYENFLNKFNDFIKNGNEKIFKHEKINKHIVIHFLNKLNDEIRNKIFIEYKEEIIGKEIKEFIIIHKLSSEEKQLKIIEKSNEVFSLINKEKGVKNIIDKIIKFKKPIVGHNCYIDLLYIQSHFMSEIPKDYKEFKKRMINIFQGGIYDTKYLYNESSFNFSENRESNNVKNNIHLECLYTNLSNINLKLDDVKKIKIKIPEGFIDYLDENNTSKFHQADYDSFTTGCSYIFMSNILGENFIKEHANKLNCYKGLYSCFDLNNFDNNEEYLNNCSDVFILTFNDKIENDKIKENIINSKYINIKLSSKDIGNSIIIFINSENKSKLMKLINEFNNKIFLKTIKEYKEDINNKE